MIDDGKIHCTLDEASFMMVKDGIISVKQSHTEFPSSNCKLIPTFEEFRSNGKKDEVDPGKKPINKPKDEISEDLMQSAEFLKSIEITDLTPTKGSYYGGTKICFTLNKGLSFFSLKSIVVGNNYCTDLHFPRRTLRNYRFKEEESNDYEDFRFSEASSKIISNVYCCFTQAEVYAKIVPGLHIQEIPEKACMNLAYSIQKCSDSQFVYVYSRSTSFHSSLNKVFIKTIETTKIIW